MVAKTRVAVAQVAPVYHDRDATVTKACALIAEAGAGGARLVAFPEAYIAGYPYWAMLLAPTEINDDLATHYQQALTVGDDATERLCAAARDAGVEVVMGCNEREGGTIYNTQLFIGSDGVLRGRHRKLVPTSHERMVWGRGDGADLALFDTNVGRIGGLICFEHANPLFRYALQGQGQEIHVSAWPGGIPIEPVIDAAMRHYAFEGQCHVLVATAILDQACLDKMGGRGGLASLAPGGGASMIIGPRGNVLAQAEPDFEGLLYADLDPHAIDAAKSIVDTGGHYARPDVVQLLLHREARTPVVMARGSPTSDASVVAAATRAPTQSS